MTKRTGLIHVLFLVAAMVVSGAGLAHAGITYINKTEARVGETLEATASSAGYWEINGGSLSVGSDEASTAVQWTLKSTIPASPTSYVLWWTNANDPTDKSKKTVYVYSHASIQNKSSLEIIYYPGLTETITAKGGKAPYTWTVIHPDTVDPDTEQVVKNVSIHHWDDVDENTLEFEAPSEGAFAGVHFIRLSDSLSEPDPDLTQYTGNWMNKPVAVTQTDGSVITTTTVVTGTVIPLQEDQVGLYEFAWLDGDAYIVAEGAGRSLSFDLTGAPTYAIDDSGNPEIGPDGKLVPVKYAFKLYADNNTSSLDYTSFNLEYGAVSLGNEGVAISGTLPVTYTAPLNTSTGHSFWLRGEADHAVIYTVGSTDLNVYDVWLGPIYLRDTYALSGRIVDAEGNPISNAKVMAQVFGKANPYNLFSLNPHDVSDANGDFSIPNVLTENRWLMYADAFGYVPKQFTSDELEDKDGEIVMQRGVHFPDVSISGHLTCEPYVARRAKDGAVVTYTVETGQMVNVALLDYSMSPPTVLAETQCLYDPGAGPLPSPITYTLTLANQDLSNGDSYAIVAYTGGPWSFCGTTKFRVPDYQYPYSLDVNLKFTSVTHTPANNYYETTFAPIGPASGPVAEQLGLTVLGGYKIQMADYDLAHGSVVDIGPGVINTSLLTPTVGADLSTRDYPNPWFEGDSYSVYANGSPSITLVNLYTQYMNNTYKDMGVKPGAVVSLKFDLQRVMAGDIERKVFYARHADDPVSLETEEAVDVPLSDILATDYMGDGIYGWVTFRVKNTYQHFAVGQSSGTRVTDLTSYTWPTFDRYELWGCFVDSLQPKQPSRNLWLPCLLGLCMMLALCKTLDTKRKASRQ